MARVEGTITLDGKPLPNAYVLFQPKQGRLEDASTGQTDNSGRFSLARIADGASGARIGLHKISITTVPPQSKADERNLESKDLVPSKYRDGSLSFEVPDSGSDAANFALTTR